MGVVISVKTPCCTADDINARIELLLGKVSSRAEGIKKVVVESEEEILMWSTHRVLKLQKLKNEMGNYLVKTANEIEDILEKAIDDGIVELSFEGRLPDENGNFSTIRFQGPPTKLLEDNNGVIEKLLAYNPTRLVVSISSPQPYCDSGSSNESNSSIHHDLPCPAKTSEEKKTQTHKKRKAGAEKTNKDCTLVSEKGDTWGVTV